MENLSVQFLHVRLDRYKYFFFRKHIFRSFLAILCFLMCTLVIPLYSGRKLALFELELFAKQVSLFQRIFLDFDNVCETYGNSA